MPKDIFTALVSPKDVLEVTLSDAVFAASLDQVVSGTVPSACGLAPELLQVGESATHRPPFS